MASKIEWLRSADGKPGYSINPVKGLCPVACSYCYARRLYKRFHWNPEITYMPIDAIHKAINQIDNRRGAAGERTKIFIGSTMELFGEWVDTVYMNALIGLCGSWPEHTFIFLTKRPENLIKWSPYPTNVWVGVSATDVNMVFKAEIELARVQATVKFLSIEPLLSWNTTGTIEIEPQYFADVWKEAGINWLIIGQCTPVKASTAPKLEWLKNIVDAADKANIPIFLKNNLSPLLGEIQ